MAHGIASSVDGAQVRIGSAHFIFEDEKCGIPGDEQARFDALSPALSETDAGIAISNGATIAREIADITIAADSLWELVRLRQVAMALMRRIQNNYRFVIGFNGALIGLGVAGILPPATSAMLHNLSTLGVSLHSMSALPVARQETKVPNDL